MTNIFNLIRQCHIPVVFVQIFHGKIPSNYLNNLPDVIMALPKTQLPANCDRNLIPIIANNEGFLDYSIKCSEVVPKGDNFLGELFRIEISEKSNGKKMRLILKFAPTGDAFNEMMPIDEMYFRETSAYCRVFPKLCSYQEKLNLPETEKFHHARQYPSPDRMLILEDLSIRNYAMYDKTKPLDLNHCKIAVKKMALFHALSFVAKKKDPEGFDRIANYCCEGIGFGPNVKEMCNTSMLVPLSCVEDEEKRARLQVVTDGMIDFMEKIFEAGYAHPYGAICQGDAWTNNFLFRKENGKPVDIIFVDYQIMRYCSPCTDLFYLIYSCTDKAFRNLHMQSLMEFYHSCLSQRISLLGCDPEELYPKAVFQKHQKELDIYGLVMGMMLIPIVLCERNQVPDMNEYIKDPENNLIVSDMARKRLNELIDDFYERGAF